MMGCDTGNEMYPPKEPEIHAPAPRAGAKCVYLLYRQGGFSDGVVRVFEDPDRAELARKNWQAGEDVHRAAHPEWNVDYTYLIKEMEVSR
jgi:hypothetical protein